MSKVRIPMKNLKTILRLFHVENHTMRNIASITGTAYSTVHDNIALAKSRGLQWPQIEAMNEEELESALTDANARPLPDWAYIDQELKRPGVTLQLLWQEYKEAHPNGYQYSRFCKPQR